MIQTVEIVPTAPSTASDAPFWFRLGLHWPLLPLPGAPYQVSNWLGPTLQDPALELNVAAAIEDLTRIGLPWLFSLEDSRVALQTAQQTNLQLYASMPMARGWGGDGSPWRYMLIAFFAFLCGDPDQARHNLDLAAHAIGSSLAATRRPRDVIWHQALSAAILS